MLYSSSIAWSFRQSDRNTRKFFIKTLTFIPLCVFKNIICPFWAVLTDRPSDRPIDRHLGSWGNTSKIVSIRMTTIISYLLIQDHTSQDHFCSVIDEFPVWNSGTSRFCMEVDLDNIYRWQQWWWRWRQRRQWQWHQWWWW